MKKPRIEINFFDGGNDDPANSGYIRTAVNGHMQTLMFFKDFDTGNDARIHTGLRELVERVYERGYLDGERESKNKVNEIIDWAKS